MTPPARRPHALALAFLALLAGLLLACSGGGGGGPEPGSDEWVDREASAIAKQAAKDLDAALKRIDRCAPTKQQIAEVYDALGRLQATGDDTPAVDQAVASRVAPAARSIARAVARGEQVGYDGPQADALAKGAGIDTQQPGWMDDPECEKNWIVVFEHVSDSAVPGILGRLQVSARVPVAVARDGAASGSAPGAVTAAMQPIPPCAPVFSPASTIVSIRGRQIDRRLELTLSMAAYVIDGKSICDLPIGRVETATPLPMPAMAELPMIIEAFGGATARDDRAGITLLLLPAR